MDAARFVSALRGKQRVGSRAQVRGTASYFLSNRMKLGCVCVCACVCTCVHVEYVGVSGCELASVH